MLVPLNWRLAVPEQLYILTDASVKALVVEQDIATWAGARYDPYTIGDGALGLYASPKPEGSVAEVEAAIDAEIDRLLAEGVTEEEVGAAVRRMRAETIYALDGLGAGARIVGRALVIGLEADHVETWSERIAEIGVEDVNAAARQVFASKASVTGLLLPAGSGGNSR